MKKIIFVTLVLAFFAAPFTMSVKASPGSSYCDDLSSRIDGVSLSLGQINRLLEIYPPDHPFRALLTQIKNQLLREINNLRSIYRASCIDPYPFQQDAIERKANLELSKG